jgi:hypothetical protein
METQQKVGYRYAVVNNVDNKIIGTGLFKSTEQISEQEQLDLLHKYTNGIYLKDKGLLSIDISESNE